SLDKESVSSDEQSREAKRQKVDSPSSSTIKGTTNTSKVNEKPIPVVHSGTSKESSKTTISNNNNTLASLLEYSDDSNNDESNSDNDKL
ncbi:15187_t:CDS:1, partial [Acaulospora morrowiae]